MTAPPAPPPFSRIVVGYDGSREADEALVLAAQLRARGGGELVLVNVFPFFRGFALPVTPKLYGSILRLRAEQILSVGADRLDPAVPNRRVAVAGSSVARGLSDVAEDEHADVIVLGPTHHRLCARAGLPVARRLLQDAPCAVAIASGNQRARFTGDALVAVAYDGSPEASVALHEAYAIAQAWCARVDVCRVVDRDAGDARRQLEAAAALAPAAVQARGRLLVGAPAAQVLHAAMGDADLVVAGSRSYGPIRRAISGGVTDGLIVAGRLPLLVTPRSAMSDAPAVADRRITDASASA